jgi:Lrp/AsnC family leucine-responsive transcriptional regulator
VRLTPGQFGQSLAAFVFVDVDRAGNGSVAGELAAIAGVQEVHQIAGEDGYLVKVRASGPEALGRLLRENFTLIKGVRATRTQIVLSTFKETRRIDLDPS